MTADSALRLASRLGKVSLLLRGPFGSAIVGRTRKYALAARQLHRSRVAGVGAVLGAEALDGRLVAHLQRVPAPAIARQSVGRAAFTLPVRDRAALVLGVQINPDVRIHPVQFGNHTLQRDGFRCVELRRERMMRCQRQRRRKQKPGAGDKDG